MSYVPATEQLVTEIFVRDLQRAKDFYLALGFSLLGEKADFVALTWEDHRLFLDERPNLPEVPAFPQANMRIMVPDVDNYWQKAQMLNARVIASIADREYGLRDFTISDPDGFGVRFGSWI